MTARLKTLERYLACLRAQAALGPVADDFTERWERALDQGWPLSDILEIVEAATRVSVPIIDLVPLNAYLKSCAKAGRVPDPLRVITAIVHGYAETRFIGLNGETCTCPARERLIKPLRSRGDASGGDREGPSLMTRIARSLEGMGPSEVNLRGGGTLSC